MLLYITIACFIISLIFFGCVKFSQIDLDFSYTVTEVGKVCSIVSGAVLIILVVIMGVNRISEAANRLNHQEEYKILYYRAKNLPNLHDELAFNKIDILVDVRNWNTKYEKYQYYSRNYWIGNLFAKSIYDETSYIDLDDIILD